MQSLETSISIKFLNGTDIPIETSDIVLDIIAKNQGLPLVEHYTIYERELKGWCTHYTNVEMLRGFYHIPASMLLLTATRLKDIRVVLHILQHREIEYFQDDIIKEIVKLNDTSLVSIACDKIDNIPNKIETWNVYDNNFDILSILYRKGADTLFYEEKIVGCVSLDLVIRYENKIGWHNNVYNLVLKSGSIEIANYLQNKYNIPPYNGHLVHNIIKSYLPEVGFPLASISYAHLDEEKFNLEDINIIYHEDNKLGRSYIIYLDRYDKLRELLFDNKNNLIDEAVELLIELIISKDDDMLKYLIQKYKITHFLTEKQRHDIKSSRCFDIKDDIDEYSRLLL